MSVIDDIFLLLLKDFLKTNYTEKVKKTLIDDLKEMGCEVEVTLDIELKSANLDTIKEMMEKLDNENANIKGDYVGWEIAKLENLLDILQAKA